MTTDFLLSILAAGAAGGLLAIVALLVFDRASWRMSCVQLVALAAVIVGAVLTAWSILMEQAALAVVYWGVAGVAGGMVSCVLFVRNRLAQAALAQSAQAFEAGQLYQMAAPADHTDAEQA